MNRTRPHAVSAATKQMLLIWWFIWSVILTGLVGIYLMLGRGPLPTAPAAGNPFPHLVGLVPLFVSIVIRWLVLPRYAGSLAKALPMFIVGLALAETCGILGIFLGGPFRDDLFVLGVLGALQFIPVFARQLAEPKPEGFIPNR